MTLSPGIRLGPYEVAALTGVGGPPSLALELRASDGESPEGREGT
jgi:hypothetical protein